MHEIIFDEKVRLCFLGYVREVFRNVIHLAVSAKKLFNLKRVN